MQKLEKQRAEQKITRAQFKQRKQKLEQPTAAQRIPKQKQKQKPRQSNPQRTMVAAPPPLAPGFSRKGLFPRYGPKQALNASPTTVPNPINDYVNTLIYPDRYISRVPDAEKRATAVFRSISNYDVPFTIDPTTGKGNFSFCVQPKIGGLNNPQNFQTAIANVPTANWSTTDWGLQSNYVSNVDGRNPALDINYNYLAQGAPGFYGATYIPTNYGVMAGNQLLDTTASPGVAVTTTLNPQNTQRGFSIHDISHISVPMGLWAITLLANYRCAAAGNGKQAVFAGPSVAAGTLVARLDGAQTVTLSNGIYSQITMTVVVTANNGCTLQCALVDQTNAFLPASFADLGDLRIFATPITYNGVDPNTSIGAIEKLRPVAQSVWLTYMGAELIDGGQVSAALVNGDFITSNYFSNNPNNLGQAQNVANLGSLSHDAMNGRLSKGVYAFWKPEDEDDLNFYTIAEHVTHTYPGIICSGVIQPATTISGTTSGTLRLRVCTVFEFITEVSAFESEVLPGSTAIIDLSTNLIGQMCPVMENDTHMEWVRRALRKVSAWCLENRQLLSLAGTALMAAL